MRPELVAIEGATHLLRRVDGSPAAMSQQQVYERIAAFFKRIFSNVVAPD